VAPGPQRRHGAMVTHPAKTVSDYPSEWPVAPLRSAAGSRLEAVRVVLGCGEWDQVLPVVHEGPRDSVVHGGLYARAIHAPSEASMK
jgi:hypothetical protein